MGGRGASSGVGENKRKYGTEYETLYETDMFKFVRYNYGAATAPMETMTEGRVYVTINRKNQIKSISFYDENNKRYKQIDQKHPHMVAGIRTDPHTHYGYEHDEGGTYDLSSKEREVLERVKTLWYNHISKE